MAHELNPIATQHLTSQTHVPNDQATTVRRLIHQRCAAWPDTDRNTVLAILGLNEPGA